MSTNQESIGLTRFRGHLGSVCSQVHFRSETRLTVGQGKNAKVLSITKNHGGYTLLEVLIASAIFVAVLMIATGTFATANRVRERTAVTQQTTETARFLVETLARDIRASTGIKSGSIYSLPPFDFYSGVTPVRTLGLDPIIETEALKTVRFDTAAASPVERLYQFTTASGGDLTLKKGVDPAQSLIPDGFDVTNGRFRGISHAVLPLRTQPFVLIEFTVVHTQSGTNQFIRTAVTSRELSTSGL